MNFLEPNKELVDWLIGFAGDRHIVEVGCGRCALIDALVETGRVKAMGIEPHYFYYFPEGQVIRSYVLPLYAQDLNLDAFENSLTVCARPDHGGWVEEVLDRMPANSQFLYLGLEKNVELDLGDFPRDQVDPPECEGYEVAYLL